MNPERWSEVGRLFEAAQGLARENREAFLDGECKGDTELKSEVESLLASQEEAGFFLERPAVEDLLPSPADSRHRVGSYELLEEIGHGGMGVVYKAVRRDQGFERFVAVKLVKRGMDTDFILSRFESERRILAGLDHPNIARVLDGGSTDDGLPFFVMELIEGRNVLNFCDEKALAVPERLALFRQVCSAVQYAHQRLVIHRDIKPSNILVTAEGVPKLLDFGLAKVLAPDAGDTIDRTETAMRILTPEYASPEQIRGDQITTSSDVYSLGVVLYELLTERRPYALKTRSPEEITDAVLHREPERPSTKRRLHRDLDSIVLTALRKEPERRYASVEQLSEDIRRHLEGLPVRATGDSLGYRAGKFVRRHRLGMAAAALVAASLVGGLTAAVYQMQAARVQRDRAQLETAKAQQVSVFLRSLFESSYPRRHKGEKLTAEDLLDIGASRVDRELASQPEVQASMSALLGSVYLEMNLLDKAEPLLQRSLALREKLLGKDHMQVAESLYALGRLKARRTQYLASRALLQRAVRIRERAKDSSPDLAETLSQLAGVAGKLGELERGRDLLRRAVAIEEKSNGANLHKWLTNLAALELDLGDLESSKGLLERALEIGVRAEGSVDVQVDATLLNLASVLRQQEDYTHALPLFERALAIDERVYGKDTQTYTYGELGELYLAMGDNVRAREFLDRSLAVGERLLGGDHLGLAAPLNYSGRLCLAEGKPKKALPLLERALALREKALHGHDLNEIAENLVDIAAAIKQLQGSSAAEPVLRRALDIQRRALVPRHRLLVPSLTALGRVLLEQGRGAQARPFFEEAVEIARDKLPEHHSQRLAAERALREQGKADVL